MHLASEISRVLVSLLGHTETACLPFYLRRRELPYCVCRAFSVITSGLVVSPGVCLCWMLFFLFFLNQGGDEWWPEEEPDEGLICRCAKMTHGGITNATTPNHAHKQLSPSWIQQFSVSLFFFSPWSWQKVKAENGGCYETGRKTRFILLHL